MHISVHWGSVELGKFYNETFFFMWKDFNALNTSCPSLTNACVI